MLIFPIVLGTFFLCFGISHIFLSFLVYEDKRELKNFKSDIFSYIFGLSNVLLVLVVLEIADIGDFQ